MERILHLALMRQSGPDRAAGQWWTVDRSEAEAILGLWVWCLESLKSWGWLRDSQARRIFSFSPDSQECGLSKTEIEL